MSAWRTMSMAGLMLSPQKAMPAPKRTVFMSISPQIHMHDMYRLKVRSIPMEQASVHRGATAPAQHLAWSGLATFISGIDRQECDIQVVRPERRHPGHSQAKRVDHDLIDRPAALRCPRPPDLRGGDATETAAARAPGTGAERGAAGLRPDRRRPALPRHRAAVLPARSL